MRLERFQIAQGFAEEPVDARAMSALVFHLTMDRGRVLRWLARPFGQTGFLSDGAEKQLVSDCRKDVSGAERKRDSG
jgi:hypothetical protein